MCPLSCASALRTLRPDVSVEGWKVGGFMLTCFPAVLSSKALASRCRNGLNEGAQIVCPAGHWFPRHSPSEIATYFWFEGVRNAQELAAMSLSAIPLQLFGSGALPGGLLGHCATLIKMPSSEQSSFLEKVGLAVKAAARSSWMSELICWVSGVGIDVNGGP